MISGFFNLVFRIKFPFGFHFLPESWLFLTSERILHGLFSWLAAKCGFSRFSGPALSR